MREETAGPRREGPIAVLHLSLGIVLSTQLSCLRVRQCPIFLSGALSIHDRTKNPSKADMAAFAQSALAPESRTALPHLMISDFT